MIRAIKNFGHLIEAVIANIIYGFPSRRVYCIGVTGTDGKTTTTSLIYHILETAGKKVAMITTVGAYIDGEVLDTGLHTTTPTAFALQRYIREAVTKGTTHLVLETTSHALDQYRDWGVHYDIGVLTNISHEHLDYHQTYERYVKAKGRLFQRSKISILNRDDKSYGLLKPLLSGKEIVTYSLHDTHADFTPVKNKFESQLVGDYNQQNCLAAVAAAKLAGIADETIRHALQSYTPPTGRMEIVYEEDFSVIIDFAHTPNSFAKVLPELAKLKKNRLIHVFGAAAQRDESKRPFMGKVASEYADIIILTAEDPRNELLSKINAEIRSGIDKDYAILKPEDYHGHIDKLTIIEISDRRRAIEFAIKIAQPGDVIVCTGKGHEQSLSYPEGERPWDEHAAVQAALRQIHPN